MTLSKFNILFLTFCAGSIFSFSPSSVNREIGFRNPNVVLNADSIEGWKVRGELQPINNFILIKVADDQNQTDGGILLSGRTKIKKTQGIVVAMGPGKYHPESGILCPIPVEAGDNVIYGKYDGTEISINGIKHNLIRDENILVKINNVKGGKINLDDIQVLYNRVLIEMDDPNTSKSGNMILSGVLSKGTRSIGVVRKVGPGYMASNGKIISMPLQEGVMVKFRDYAANDVMIGSKEYMVVEMPGILAKF